MRGFDVIGMCARNLIKRKLRTFLTLLGVMIGTGSIILMISLGLATDALFAQMIEDMSLDMTQINVSPQWGGPTWCPDTNSVIDAVARDLTSESVTRIQAIDGVQVATPLVRGQLIFRSGPYAMRADVTGIRPEALALMGYTTSYGRLLEEGDGFAAVFGSSAEKHFFDPSVTMWGDRFWESFWSDDVETLVDIFNAPIRLYYDQASLPWRWPGGDDDFGVGMEEAFRVFRSFDLTVVGVLEAFEDPFGFNMNDSRNGVIYMDVELLHTLNELRNEAFIREREECEWSPSFSAAPSSPRETYSNLFVRSVSMDETERIAREIRQMGYQAWFQGDWINQQRRSQEAIQTLLAAIAAISLFVAAINIANTMITSVTERTREIGIMKVIGASLMDIRKLFLTEAAVIGMLGGLLGVGLAIGGSYAMNNFEIEFLTRLNMAPPIQTEGMDGAAISLITPWLVGMALAVASGVGLVSGFYPAWHATRLSALAAIRNE